MKYQEGYELHLEGMKSSTNPQEADMAPIYGALALEDL